MKRLLRKHEAVRCTVKHSLRSREAKRILTSPWAEDSLHRTKFCFIFHAPTVRFIATKRKRHPNGCLSFVLYSLNRCRNYWSYTFILYLTRSSNHGTSQRFLSARPWSSFPSPRDAVPCSRGVPSSPLNWFGCPLAEWCFRAIVLLSGCSCLAPPVSTTHYHRKRKKSSKQAVNSLRIEKVITELLP